jgi:hypothetical protein
LLAAGLHDAHRQHERLVAEAAGQRHLEARDGRGSQR